MDLTDLELSILAIERQWWQYVGGKESAIRDLGLSVTRYHQLLNRMIDDPRIEAHDPITVKRLRRIRERGQRTRSVRRLSA